jgi:hypothetical protein
LLFYEFIFELVPRRVGCIKLLGGASHRLALAPCLAVVYTFLPISAEFHDKVRWTITLQQPTAVQVEAANGAVVNGTHLCPAKVTVLALSLRYTLETNI